MGDPSTWDTPCVLTHTIMSLKAAVFLNLLGAALALDHANCDVDNNDCSCADKAYDQCAEPNPTVSIHVGDLQECILNCDFATFQQCDWLVYYNRGPDENCLLFAQGETMQQYLDTCNTMGQPTRHPDGDCMTDSPLVCAGPGAGITCNEGCRACDRGDRCNVNYHQSACTMQAEYVTATELDSLTVEGCTAACIAQSVSTDATYFTWDRSAQACKCYNGGNRECVKEVVMAGFSHSDVLACRT